jgi:hypothetical protein
MFRAMVLTAVLVATGAPGEAGDREKGSVDAPSAFTLGAVQRELRAGLSQAEVAERLGSPNILTRDADGREAWVYDRVATDVEVTSASVSLGGGGIGRAAASRDSWAWAAARASRRRPRRSAR